MGHIKRIFIVGHPGAGKALLAKALAEKLGWQFINADFGLEFRIGRKLLEIIGKEGDKKFHECENEILLSLFNKENIVVTTDASIICGDENRQFLSSEFTVYLKVNIDTQIVRAARNLDSLLSMDDLKLFLNKLHDERDHLYDEVASFAISSDDNALEEHVSKIIDTILNSDSDIKRSKRLSLDKKDLTIFHKKLHTPISLSEQQAICLKLLAQGKTSKEIAREIHISHRTVEGHIKKMMEMLGCTTSKELISLYYS